MSPDGTGDAPPGAIALSARPPSVGDRRAIALASLAALLMLVVVSPFGEIPAAQAQVFVRVYQSVGLGAALVAAALLVGQLALQRSRAVRLLAGAYLFAGLTALANLLLMPAVTGVNAKQPHIATWLAVFWHLGFPIFLIAYALLDGRQDDAAPQTAGWTGIGRDVRRLATCTAASGLVMAGSLPWLPAVGELLPIAQARTLRAVVQTLLCLAAAGLLWYHARRSALNRWLLLVVALWACEGLLAAAFGTVGLGFGNYRARLFGMLATAVLPIVLLRENLRVYVRLVRLHQSAQAQLAEAETRTLTSSRDRDEALEALQRHVEALNVARREAESANRAKSAFLATMSHELRTPLNGVLGTVEVLQRSVLDEAQHEMVAMVRESALALQVLIDDILDVSGIEAGELRLEQRPMALAPVLERAIQVALPTARKHGIDLQLHADPGLPERVRSDARRLHQVLMHLVGNAIKFSVGTGRPGQVSLRASCDTEPVDPAWVTLEVEDNGIGIEPDRAEALFAPFIQADDTTTRRFGGSGLGLTLCRRLVTGMGGTITIRSTPGAGSCFRLRLPFERAPAVAETAEQAAAETAAAALPVAAARAAGDGAATAATAGAILVAEDNETNRRVLTRQLELLGYRAEVVDDGPQALQRWGEGGHALLLTDLHMPGMDGYALARAIRAQETDGRRRPIIALTANARPADLQRCLDVGMDGFITKPVMLERLRAALQQWLPPAAAPDGALQPQDASTPAADERPAIDLAVLATLVGDDAQVQRDILLEFQRCSLEDASALRAACADGAGAVGAALAHRLKSAARSVGAARLGALCETMERAGGGASADWLQAWMAGFDDEMMRVTQALARVLHAQGPDAAAAPTGQPLH